MAISHQQFSDIATRNGFDLPSQHKYRGFYEAVTDVRWGISDTQEVAMFLAHILQETGGFRELEERGCPAGVYDTSVGYPGREYFGRGYIQLSHSYNYKAASQALYPRDPDRLLREPELVSSSETIAWQTAFWFWHANVRNTPGFSRYQFGATTRAINSPECTLPERHGQARRRFQFYCTNLRVLGINAAPDETGCYN